MKMMTTFFSICSLLQIFACTDESVTVNPTFVDPKDTILSMDTSNLVKSDTLFYLALGDSYTIGESVNYDERYPVQLVKKLREANFKLAEPSIIARTGWTTRQLKTAIENASLRKEYDLVSLLIGVNNQYQGMDIEIYKTEFRELLQKAIQLAGSRKNRVFVVSIPDYAYTPFGQRSARISREIDTYNSLNLSIAQQLGVIYFDITPISRKGLDDPALVAPDGLHPSGKMYAAWVAVMENEVMKKLKN